MKFIFSDRWLAHHALVLDSALDLLAADRLEAARRAGSYYGFGFCTDESPPAAPRYRGLRFQITNMFIPMFVPVERWEDADYNDKYPMHVEAHLCDILNAPSKLGPDTLKYIQKQFLTKGAVLEEGKAGTGDGGGEMEGISGVHALMVQLMPDYVRHRCGDHISWRVLMAGLDAMAPNIKDLEALNVYLTDGITWTRLAAIATLPIDQGGLAIMVYGATSYYKFFKDPPPPLIEGRPVCYLMFVEWVLARQTVLKDLVEVDLQQRNLEGAHIPKALRALQSKRQRILRHVERIFIKKALYLHHWTEKHDHIAAHTLFDALVAKCVDILTTTAIDDTMLEFFGKDEAFFAAIGIDVSTVPWYDVAITLSEEDVDAHDAIFEEVRQYHMVVATRMSSHLKQTMDHISRSTWLSAQMLSRDASVAQLGAITFAEHLQRARSDALSAYDKHWIDDPVKMQLLNDFTRESPPALLWRARGKYASIFRFLAVRFLTCPDSVVSCERIHAMWQWIMLSKRSMSFKLLNALLKIAFYLQHNNRFPTHAELQPYLQLVTDATRIQVRDLRDRGDVAAGMVSSYYYLQRFNLRPIDVELLKARTGGSPNLPKTFSIAWHFYNRNLFEANSVYRFTKLDANKYLFVSANKSLPGRVFPAPGEAIGRALQISWFEFDKHDDDGNVVIRPVAANDGELPLVSANLAEISRAAGFHPPLAANASPRDAEKLHDNAMLSHGITRYTCSRADSFGWRFILKDAMDHEDFWIDKTPLHDMSKVALARLSQKREGWSMAQCEANWKYRKTVLLQMLLPAGGAAAAPAAAARGRGAGVGAAKAAGKAAGGKGKGKGAARGGRARARGRGP